MKQEVRNISKKFDDFLIKKQEDKNQRIKHYSFKRKKKKLIHYLVDSEEYAYRIKLLKCLISSFKVIIIYYSEDPKFETLIGTWNTISDNYFILEDKNSLQFDSFLKWLYLGDWKLYCSNENVINKSNEPKIQTQKFIENITDCTLDSFTDNIEWTLSLKY